MVQPVTSEAVRPGAFRLSLVVPMYNEDQVAAMFVERVLPIVARITPDFEILFVNDGSRDGTMEVYYDRPARAAGETKWRFWKLWNLALEGIFSFSTLPLRIWSYIGLTVSLFAATYLMWVVLKTLIMGIDTPGYASLLSVVLLFSGLNMLGLGIIGEYLGRVFMETKQRPLYLVQEWVGVEGFPEAP